MVVEVMTTQGHHRHPTLPLVVRQFLPGLTGHIAEPVHAAHVVDTVHGPILHVGGGRPDQTRPATSTTWASLALLVLGEGVALHCAGEPALRAEAETLQRHVR